MTLLVPLSIEAGCTAAGRVLGFRLACWAVVALAGFAATAQSTLLRAEDRPAANPADQPVEPAAKNRRQAERPPSATPDAKGRDVAGWFQKLDADRDGLLKEAEVPSEVWRRLQRADLDANGQVTLAEVQAARDDKGRPGGVGGEFKVVTYQDSGKSLRYSWLPPAKLEPGQSYPLVLCLHGRGGSTRAAAVLASPAMREKYPCFVLAPECNQPDWWASNPVLGRGTHGEKLPLVISLVRLLMKEQPIDAARVYVTGQSMGGVGSWGACARHADLFAAAVPVCGAWSVDDVPKMKAVPIWAFHGELDTTVPTRHSRDLTAALKALGATVKYTEYPGVGHGSWEPAYADPQMWQWLFAQKKAPAAESK